MAEKKRIVWGIAMLALGLCGALVLVLRCPCGKPHRADESAGAVAPVAAVEQEGVSPAVHDPERYRSDLMRLGSVHHERIAEARTALNELRAYEETLCLQDADLRALADEIAQAGKRAAERQESMRAEIEADEEWRRRMAAAREAEARLEEVRAALYRRVRAIRAGADVGEAEGPALDEVEGVPETGAARLPEEPEETGGESASAPPEAAAPRLHAPTGLPAGKQTTVIAEEAAALRAATAEVRARRQEVAARHAELARGLTQSVEEIASETAAVAAKTDALRGRFEQDPAWQALDRAFREADARREEARREAQKLVRSRMRHDFESAKEAKEAKKD